MREVKRMFGTWFTGTEALALNVRGNRMFQKRAHDGTAAEGMVLAAIDVIVPSPGFRTWQQRVIERLSAAGHDVAVLHGAGTQWPTAIAPALRWERRLFRRHGGGLAGLAPEPAEIRRARRAALRLDLTGSAEASEVPTLTLLFDGNGSDAAVPLALARGRLPDIEALLDRDRLIARAAPMVDKRESAALGTDDVLARAVTLAVAAAARVLAGDRGEAIPMPPQAAGLTLLSVGFLAAYAGSAMPRLGREAVRRARYRHAHWRTGYRFIDGPGVAETARLGDGWRQVPDAGDHFYADPFPHHQQGRDVIFVEDYPHATGKAVISVVRFDGQGNALAPEPILEEPFHLSYPQVFDWRGQTWMLPEGSASGRLTLYRAARYPDRWSAETVLLEGCEVSDATLLEHAGLWWLFATERDGHGSTSDTMAVFSAPSIEGPWTPHVMNPIAIDRRLARPGGAFVRSGGRILLPVQDGTEGYGGGLGLSELLALDAETVRLSEPHPIMPEGDWPYRKIHTLNRSGRLEVIDGIAAVRR
jgi:hypothetical protein